MSACTHPGWWIEADEQDRIIGVECTTCFMRLSIAEALQHLSEYYALAAEAQRLRAENERMAEALRIMEKLRQRLEAVHCHLDAWDLLDDEDASGLGSIERCMCQTLRALAATPPTPATGDGCATGEEPAP